MVLCANISLDGISLTTIVGDHTFIMTKPDSAEQTGGRWCEHIFSP